MQPWFVSNIIILLSNKVGDFVVCVYNADKNILLGKAQESDRDDDEVLISFMSLDLPLNLNMQPFCWPTRLDGLWVKRNSIFINFHHPKKQRKASEFHKKF